ncbi:hypothetical protein AACH06_28295 [Ideonella sp. DXS29W]|uniref:EF-hand domain-containing protein n=1 Tax=Ideonella lacteola TaxID=2984193 RepID=A0ABU9BXN3_9BURK
MTLGISSAASGASNLWSLLSSRAATSTSTASSFSQRTGGTASASNAATGATSRPDGPPPPPSQFDSTMSTAQFAHMAGAGAARRGPPPGEDPIASLDSDDDGSVSSDEFGLDAASDEVQQLFAAIDEDGSGDLSAGEIDSFREQMMNADGGQPPEPPVPAMGPPPAAGDADNAGDTGSSAAITASQPDVSQFLQQLAQRYARLTADQSESALSVTA